MDFLTNVIQDFMNRIGISDKRLEYLTGPERTRELYKNGNLHGELRKYTEMANDRGNVFYCSICGDKFKHSEDRTQHTRDRHEGF